MHYELVYSNDVIKIKSFWKNIYELILSFQNFFIIIFDMDRPRPRD